MLAAAAVAPAPLVGPGLVKLFAVGAPIAAQVVFLAPVEAMMKVRKAGTTGDLPLTPYSSMAGCGMVWATYGYLLNDMTILYPNLSAIVLGSAYTAMYTKFAPPETSVMPHIAGLGATAVGLYAASTALPLETAVQLLGYGGSAFVISMFGGPLAAIKTVLEQKSTASLPFAFTVATFVNCTLWTSYGALVIQDPFVWFPNLLGLASSIVQLSLFARFGFAPAQAKQE